MLNQNKPFSINNTPHIFLDIDGVFNSTVSAIYFHEKHNAMGTGGFFNPDEEAPSVENVLWDEDCIVLFAKLIKDTGAHIVMSSTWRKYYDIATFKAMFKLYEVENLKIVGYTPVLSPRHSRGNEIQQYVTENNIFNYVILDDDMSMLKNQMPHFVNVNPEIGLSEKDCDKAKQILFNFSNHIAI